MDFFETVSSRRSIRKFKDEPVSDEQIGKILEAARIAPSASNAQPWKFLVVRAQETRAALEEAAYGQKFILQAPVVIVCLGDRKIFKKWLRRGKELVDIGAVDPSIMEDIGDRYRGRDPKSTDTGIFANCMVAVEHMALASTALGLGSCWVQLVDFAKVSAALNLPDHLFPAALLPVGYADQSPGPRPRYGLSEVAFDGSVDNPWPDKNA